MFNTEKTIVIYLECNIKIYDHGSRYGLIFFYGPRRRRGSYENFSPCSKPRVGKQVTIIYINYVWILYLPEPLKGQHKTVNF